MVFLYLEMLLCSRQIAACTVTLYESGVALVEKLEILSPLQNVLAESCCRRTTEEESLSFEVNVIL